MSDTNGAVQDRAPRYEVSDYTDVTVTLAKKDTTCEAFSAVLVDLSANGARFRADRLLAVKEVLTIEIDVPLAGRKLTVCGEVCWVAPAPGDSWWLGCSLKPPIPKNALDEFAKARVLERREDPRRRVELESLTRWELNADTANAEILNFSRGGFCMRQCTETLLGERVLLEVRPEGEQLVLIRGKAIWQIESSDGYLIGCEFVCREDFLTLKALKKSPSGDGHEPLLARRRIKPQQSGGPETCGTGPSQRRRVLGIAAAFAIILACVAVGNGTLPLPKFLRTNRTHSLDSTTAHSSSTLSPSSAQEPAGTTLPTTTASDPAQLGSPTMDLQRQEDRSRNGNRTSGSWLETAQPSTTELHAPGVNMAKRRDLRYDIAPVVDDSTQPVLSRAKSMRRPKLNAAANAPPELSQTNPDTALAALQKSRDEFHRGEYEDAAASLQTAIWHDTTNAEYRYFLAIIRFHQDQLDAAERNVQKAVELERERPVEAWGRTMERFQGRARLWLEKQRRKFQTR